jgi:hypothetical protein
VRDDAVVGQERLVAAQILREAREEVVRADAKASMLLAIYAVAGSVLGGALLAGDWSPSNLDWWGEALWWGAALLGAAALASVGLAVYPRIGNKVAGRPALTYFNDVALIEDPAHVLEALKRIDQFDRDLNQLIQLSRIARRKYVWIRRAMVCAAAWLSLLGIVALLAYLD